MFYEVFNKLLLLILLLLLLCLSQELPYILQKNLFSGMSCRECRDESSNWYRATRLSKSTLKRLPGYDFETRKYGLLRTR